MKKLIGVVLVSLMVIGLSLGAAAAEPIKVGKAEAAAHGTKCFTVAFVVLQGDTIVGAYLDEYQFMPKDEVIGVPNSDMLDGFASAFKDPNMVLASKKVNNAYYSNNMSRAGSTVTIADNFKAIENFVIGKTVAELQQILANTTKEAIIDVVTGATLQDTYGYLVAILAAALNAQNQ